MNNFDNLINFLFKSGLNKEAAELLKIAAYTKEDLQEQFPDLFKLYRDDVNPNMAAGIFKAIKKLLDKNSNALSGVQKFEDLQLLLKNEKKQKIDKFFKSIIKEYGKDVPIEELESARIKGLNKEEILFLLRDRQNHSWQEKVDMAYQFNDNKARIDGLGADASITKFENIDIAHSKIFANFGGDEYLREFYSEIRDKAIKTSDVIYNSKKYIVVATKSVEASQYWEQSAVSTDKDGEIHAGLCTARHNLNYFNDYYDPKYQLIFVIITKHIPTLLEIPYTKFSDKNYFWNLISMQIVLDEDTGDAEVVEGRGATVNRQNHNVYKEDIAFALGDEYQLIFKEVEKYIIDRWEVSKLNYNPKNENYEEKSGLAIFKDLNEAKMYSTRNDLEYFSGFVENRNIDMLLVDNKLSNILERTKKLGDEHLIKAFKYSIITPYFQMSNLLTLYNIFKDKELFKKEFILKLLKFEPDIFLDKLVTRKFFEQISLMLTEEEIISVLLKLNQKGYFKSHLNKFINGLKATIENEKRNTNLYNNKKLFSEILNSYKKAFYEVLSPIKFFINIEDYEEICYYTDIFLHMLMRLENVDILKQLRRQKNLLIRFNRIYKKFISDHPNEDEKNKLRNKLKTAFSSVSFDDFQKYLIPVDDSDDHINEDSYLRTNSFISILKENNPNRVYEIADESIVNIDNIEAINPVDAFRSLFGILALRKETAEKISEEEITGMAYSLGKKIKANVRDFGYVYHDIDLSKNFLDENNLNKYKNILVKSYLEKNILQDKTLSPSIVDLAIGISTMRDQIKKDDIYNIAFKIFEKRFNQDFNADDLTEIDKDVFTVAVRGTLVRGNYSRGCIDTSILKLFFEDFDFFKKIISQLNDPGSLSSMLNKTNLLFELGKKYVYFVGLLIVSEIHKVRNVKNIFYELRSAGLDDKDVEKLVCEDKADPLFLCSSDADIIAKRFNFTDSEKFKKKVEDSLRKVSEKSKSDTYNAQKLPRIISRSRLKNIIVDNTDILGNIIESYKINLSEQIFQFESSHFNKSKLLESIEKLGYIVNESDLDNNNFFEIIKLYRESLKNRNFHRVFLDVIKSKEDPTIQNIASILGKDLFDKFRKNKDLIKTLISDTDSRDVIQDTRIKEYSKFMFDKATVGECIYEMSRNRRMLLGRQLSLESIEFIIKNFSYSVISFIENSSSQDNLTELLKKIGNAQIALKYYKTFEKFLKESVKLTSFKNLFASDKYLFLVNAPEDMKKEIINHIYYGDNDLKISVGQLIGLIVGSFKIGSEEVNKIYLNKALLNKAVLDVDIEELIKFNYALRELFHHYGVKLEDGSAEEKFEALNILSSLFEKMDLKDIEDKNLSYLYNKIKEKSNADLDMIRYLKSRISDSVVNNKDKHYIQKFIAEGLHKRDEYDLITNWITKNTDMLNIISDEFEEEVTSEIPVGEKIESLQVQIPEDDSKEILREKIKDNLLKTLNGYDKVSKFLTPDTTIVLNKKSKMHYINFLIFVYLYDRKILDSSIVIDQKGEEYKVKSLDFFSKSSDYFNSFDNIEKFIDYLISYSEEIAGTTSVDEELLPQNLDLSVSQPETKDISEEILEKNSGIKRYDKIKNIFSKVGR